MTINCPYCNKELELEGITFKKKVEAVLNIDYKPKTDTPVPALVLKADLGNKVIEAGNARARGTNKDINKLVFHSQGVPDDFGDAKAWSSISGWFTKRRETGKSSAHFFIDFSGNIYALVPIDAIAWHAGTEGNKNSIGVEVAGQTNRLKFTPAQEKAARELTLYLKSTIPTIKVVKTHADFGKPGCPFKDGSNNPFIKELNSLIA